MLPNNKRIKDKAREILASKFNKKPKKLSITTFPQTFPDTACLFRQAATDFAGQAFTTVNVSVIYDKADNIVMVFQDEKPVYALSEDFDKKLFWDDVKRHGVKPFYLANYYE